MQQQPAKEEEKKDGFSTTQREIEREERKSEDDDDDVPNILCPLQRLLNTKLKTSFFMQQQITSFIIFAPFLFLVAFLWGVKEWMLKHFWTKQIIYFAPILNDIYKQTMTKA
jgi:hypothetical protein